MQSQQQPIKWCKDIFKIKSSLGLAWRPNIQTEFGMILFFLEGSRLSYSKLSTDQRTQSTINSTLNVTDSLK